MPDLRKEACQTRFTEKRKFAMKMMILFFGLSSHLLLAQSHIAFLCPDVSNPISEPHKANIYSVSNFELAGGMVIVRASINGEPGDFILDTGAPGVVLHSAGEDGLGSQGATGIGGKLEIKEVYINTFEWGIIHRKCLKGHQLNINHLELACGRKIKGLIGYDAFRDFEIYFDYRNKTVKIFNAKEAGFFRSGKDVKAIPFSLYGHIPVITANVGGKKALFGLDSGAEVNLLDARFMKIFSEQDLTGMEEETIKGLGNQTENALAANLSSTIIDGENFPDMRYLFTDLTYLQQQLDLPIDGLLGFPFFKNVSISINYKQRKLYIWN
jgi:hypothetical protein